MVARRQPPLHSFLLLLLFLITPSLHAHAILITASPKANQVVAGPDISVQLRFNSRIDAKRSRVTLIAGDGSKSPLLIENQTSPDMVVGQLKGLNPGLYVIRWQVLAVDGHITRGELPFQVH